MRLHSLLSFFDEPPALLAEHVNGLALAGVSHVVAMDGRYALYPAGEDVSALEQVMTLHDACRHHGIGLTVSEPAGAWAGGEVQKRTALFAAALGLSDPGDWWFNLDTDMIVKRAPEDLLARLADASEAETAVVRIWDVTAAKAKSANWNPESRMRALFLAQPIVVLEQHFNYRTLDGRVLWQGAAAGEGEALDLAASVTVEHWPNARSPGRVMQKAQYYNRRDESGVEYGPCTRCGERRAVARFTVGLRLVASEAGKVPAGRVEELCGVCGREQEAVNARKLRQWKFDPTQVTFSERYSLPKTKGER